MLCESMVLLGTGWMNVLSGKTADHGIGVGVRPFLADLPGSRAF